MELNTAIKLIQTPHLNPGFKPQVWADLGCGSGLFSRALATQLADGSTIYAIDKTNSFDPQNAGINGTSNIIFNQQDIEEQDLGLPLLDGILMANVLHYIKDKQAFLQNLKRQIRPGASFIIVEYDTEMPVPHWVPYPVSFESLRSLFAKAGLERMEQISRVPSRYRRDDLYSALILT